MFKDVPSQFDFPAEEKRILEFWDKSGVYQKSLDQRKGGKPFVFYEGPPTANGLPHPGHCLTRAIKDLFPRYRTMCGDYCERKAGWDTHGLPVEVEVCKELGIHSKEDIENFGVEPFIHKCMESVFRYTKEWENVTRRLGFWVNLEEAYVTYHQSYVESVWWALKTLFDAGMLYQGHKIVWWWAQGGTALSSGEVGQGYREVDDPSVYVKFPIVMDERAAAKKIKPNTNLLVWTTTPWTLPSNTFAAVNKDFDYVTMRNPATGEGLVFANGLRDVLVKKLKLDGWEVEHIQNGSEFVGLRYAPPFPECYHARIGETKSVLAAGGESHVAWRVTVADFVTLDAGTGLVHEAPAFGEVDFELLQAERAKFTDREAVPLLCAVAPDGKFTDAAGPKYAGRWVKECDKDIIRDMKERGILAHHEQYRHDYPFCWRADQDPLIQYPRKSWFVRTTQFRDDMLANNEQINWLPEHIKAGRFGKFLESNVDWALSRERYWGTPLPIWVCEKTGHMEAVSSWEELMKKPGVQGVEVWEAAKKKNPGISEHLKVHKPYIDAVTYQSPKDAAARMRRVPEVIDCWFDSGAMPFAQWGYPHQNRERFENNFPADFISEALDQTRGWFYSLVAISTLLFGKNGVAASSASSNPKSEIRNSKSPWPQPFRNCIVLGLLLGEDGLKMSKSKKNYKEPSYIFDNEGADAMRWLMFSGQPPWTSIRFQEAAIAEGQREFLIRLYNVYSFFVIYANIDKWTPSPSKGEGRGEGLTELDRWILSELHRTTRDVRAAMDAYDNFTATKSLNAFVDGLSNWYVRRCRDRFWKSGMDADKKAAYAVLHECLVTTTLLAAPFVPFFAESLYQNLVRTNDAAAPESVHLRDYPVADATWIDDELSVEMATVRDVVSLGRAARAESKMKVRQPLQQVEIVLADKSQTEWLRAHEGLFRDELNVKRIEFTAEADHYVNYQVKPNFKAIGPKFGKLAPPIKTALAAVKDPAAMRRELDTAGKATLVVQGESVELTPDDVQIELTAKPGWAAAQGRTAVVVLKTELTDELRMEGLAREIVHHVQQARKELDLKYEQRIALGVIGTAAIDSVVQRFGDYITSETLAVSLAITEISDVAPRMVNVEGHEVKLYVRPL